MEMVALILEKKCTGSGEFVLEWTRQCTTSNAELSQFLNNAKSQYLAYINSLTNESSLTPVGTIINDIIINTISNKVSTFRITISAPSALASTSSSTFCQIASSFFQNGLGIVDITSRFSCNSSLRLTSKREEESNYDLTGSIQDSTLTAPTSSGSGLSPGASAGIAVAVIVAIFIIICVVLFLIVSSNKNSNDGYREMR